jgi:hypothetical protein
MEQFMEQITEVIKNLSPLQITLNIVAFAILVFWIVRGIVKASLKKKAKLNKDFDPTKGYGYHVRNPQSVRVSEPLRDDSRE